jgi:THO complex subunit 7
LSTFQDEITKAETEIRQTKDELVQARKIRRNRMEYDAMAKVINQNPDRSTSGHRIEEVKSDLEKLKATEAALEDKLESRKKQFHVLVQSIHNLQALLEEDDFGGFSDLKSDQNNAAGNDVIVVNDDDDNEAVIMDVS